MKGKTVAIVGLGKSWFDYNLAKSHSVKFDEVWAINAVASVIFHDRVFMMDPPSRFLDTQDAGGQTDCMKELLQTTTSLSTHVKMMQDVKILVRISYTRNS